MAIFLVVLHEYTASATADGTSKLDYKTFAQDWNQSANGQDHFYVTLKFLHLCKNLGEGYKYFSLTRKDLGQN